MLYIILLITQNIHTQYVKNYNFLSNTTDIILKPTNTQLNTAKTLRNTIFTKTLPLLSKQSQIISQFFEDLSNLYLSPIYNYGTIFNDFFFKNESLPDKTENLLFEILTIIKDLTTYLKDLFETTKFDLMRKIELKLTDDIHNYITICLSNYLNINKVQLINSYDIIDIYIGIMEEFKVKCDSVINDTVAKLKSCLKSFSSFEIQNDDNLVYLVKVMFEIIEKFEVGVNYDEYCARLIHNTVILNGGLNDVLLNGIAKFLIEQNVTVK